MSGGSFDVGGALSKPYAREQIYAWGQKLVLSSSFSSTKKVAGLASQLFWTLGTRI